MSHYHPEGSELIFFQYNSQSVTNVYDAQAEQWTETDKAEFDKELYSNMSRPQDCHVYVRIPGREKRPPKEVVEEYFEFADEMQKETGIDPCRIGSRTDTALYVFLVNVKKNQMKFEDADPTESQWLHLAHRGGLQCCQPGFKGDAYHYDYNSHYPGICASDLLFPIGRPTKVRLAPNEKVDLDVPAIFQVHILGTHPLLKLRQVDKLTQDFIYATNVDLKCCELLNVPYKFKKTNDRYNCRRYDKCVPGKDIFGTYMRYFYKQKKKGCEFAKPMLNLLTGMLCAKKHLYVDTTKEFVLTDSMLDIQWIPGRIAYLPGKKQVFKRPDLARLGVMITAYGRHKVIQFLAEHGMIDTVARIHTDGFHLVQPLPDNVLSENMGGLRFEEKVRLDVRNMLHFKDDQPVLEEALL